MNVVRKLLEIGRHGKAPKYIPQLDGKSGSKDELLPASFSELFKSGYNLQGLYKEIKADETNTFIAYSGKNRTLYTGLAYLAGALNLQKGSPIDQLDLPQSITFFPDNRILYFDPYWNDNIFEKNNKIGFENVNFWLKNPEKTMHEDVPIESFNRIKARVSNALQDYIKILIDDSYAKKYYYKEFSAGQVRTHTGLVETFIVALLETIDDKEISSVDDFGGMINEGESFKVYIDKFKKSGNIDLKIERDN